jgi:hypothetical protein
VVSALLAVALLAGCEDTPTPSTIPDSPASPSAASESSPSSPPLSAAFRWDSPRDGSKVSRRRLTLRAAPDVPGTSDGARVVFSIDWPGSSQQTACVAEAPTDAGGWQCEVDLAALRAPAGSLKLDFDVVLQPGTIDESPDGKRTVDYRPRTPTWRAAHQVFPKGCYGPVLVIDGSSRYHVAASCGEKIGYAEGTATGSWTDQMLQPPARHTESGPQIAVDGRDLYIAYTRYGPVTDADTCGGPYSTYYEDLGVYYRKRTLPDGEWSKPRKLGRADDILDSLRVADGTLHAVVVAGGGTSLVYESDNDGSLLRGRLKGVGGWISLRVGSDGKARVAYVNARDHSIRLATTDGSETTSTVVADDGKLENPLLVLGPGNQPHLIWTRFRSEDEGCGGGALIDPAGTYYATLVDGTWRTERITRAIGPMSFVLDTDTGAVHVVIKGERDGRAGNRLTHYERSPAGGWTATPLRASVDGGFMIRLDEADGTLVVAYQDGKIIRVMTRR